jgi:uncharacterized protein YqeY
MNELVSKGKTPQDTLTEEECMHVVRRAIKQREDAYNQFTAAGRSELAEPEAKEKEVLMQFLPTQLTEEEAEAEIRKLLAAAEPLDPKMTGRYIGMCNKELRDVASGDMIKKIIERIIL